VELTLDHVVDSPVGDFFAIVTDPQRRADWNASVRRVELLTEGAPGVGTAWTELTWGLGSFQIEITEMVPDRRFREVTRDRRSELWLSLDLTPVGSQATLVHLEAGGTMRGWRRLPETLMAPLMPWLIGRDLDSAASCDLRGRCP
jgi:uncharacterized protein YndB with AHSA1/START domain